MRKSSVFITVGIILIAFAFGIFLYNEYDDFKAGEAADSALEALDDSIEQHELIEMSGDASSTENGTDSSGSEGIQNYKEKNESLGTMYPDREMPTTEVDGNTYCGVLEIPSLNMSLPVMDSWSYPKLKTAPCRYTGSVYQNNMVIAGHSYRRHFRPLYNIAIGAEVKFYDVENHLYRYTVVTRETLKPTQGLVLTEDSDDWDLTLFTCTPGGQTRCVVRCKLSESS